MSALPLLGASSQPIPWNKLESISRKQQKKWLQEQKSKSQQSDPRVMGRQMHQEHQRWEQKRKKKAAVKIQQPTALSL